MMNTAKHVYINYDRSDKYIYYCYFMMMKINELVRGEVQVKLDRMVSRKIEVPSCPMRVHNWRILKWALG